MIVSVIVSEELESGSILRSLEMADGRICDSQFANSGPQCPSKTPQKFHGLEPGPRALPND
jgi:hypothetical protein